LHGVKATMAPTLAVLCLLLAGCAAPAEPGSSAHISSSSDALPEHCSPRPNPWPSPFMHRGNATHDDKLAEVGDRVPEFAGLTVDEPRKAAMVRVTDGKDETARTALEAYRDVMGGGGLEGYKAVAVKVSYSWHQLKTWYDTANQAGAWQDGVTLGDIDELENRIHYGASDPDQVRECIAAVMRHYDIPDDAWHLDRQDPVELL